MTTLQSLHEGLAPYFEPRSPSSMLHWWPLVKDCGVPMPRTEIIEQGGDLMDWLFACLDEECVADPPGFAEVVAAIEAVGGYPAFLRTDQASAKHEWGATCYLTSEGDLARQMFALLEWHELVWAPRPAAWVVREYLPPSATFRAHGPSWEPPNVDRQMPVGAERRYFVRDGQVECHHPYWPADSVRRPSEADWEERLAFLNAESDEEIALLSGYAETIGHNLDGWWSVDFMRTAEPAWYFIDAAEGHKSWHPEDCPYSR